MSFWGRSIILFLLFVGFSGSASAAELALIVNKDNPATSITDQNLISFYMKMTRTWDHGVWVTPIAQNANLKIAKFFRKDILKQTESDQDKHWQILKQKKGILPPLRVLNSKEVIAIVAYDKGALGYVDVSRLSPEDLKKVRIIRRYSY